MKCTAIQSFAALAALPFLLLTADSATAQGPEQPTPLFQHVANAESEIIAFSAPAAFHRTSLPGTTLAPMAQTSPSLQRVLLGTTIGAALGFSTGVVAGYAISEIRPDPPFSEPSWFGPAEMYYGAALGTALGMFLGAEVASGWQADPWLTALASVAGTAAGVLVGVGVGDAVGPGAGEYVGTAAGVAVGVSIPALAAWASAR